ncbi:serine hydrolase domain-containing protein [Colwelliaceae bacterium 6471]
MLKFSKIKVVGIAIIALVVTLIWPVYEFYAYRGKAEFLPFYQFIAIPNDSPTQQQLYKNEYAATGNNAITLLTQHKTDINAPAISAAVAIDGELIWAGVSGWSDIDAKTPVTTNTQFRIGSTAKALTGTALARMVDTKLIDLDRPISQYMNPLPNKAWGRITARQLASHTAGIPHYKENTDYLGLYKTLALATRYENVEDALTIFDDSELLFTPGTQFSYSTLGTVLLSAVMKNAADIPYLEVMQKQVFEPVKMLSTMAEYQAEGSANLASFYWNDEGKSNQVRKWRNVDLSHRLAGGGFVSTSADLVKMGMAFMQDDFISAPTRAEFWTPQQLPDGSLTPDGYALGWRVITRKIDDDIGEITFVNHGGVSRGAQSWLMALPDHNMAIAVNINANTDVFWDFGKVSMQLAKIFIQARNDVNLPLNTIKNSENSENGL